MNRQQKQHHAHTQLGQQREPQLQQFRCCGFNKQEGQREGAHYQILDGELLAFALLVSRLEDDIEMLLLLKYKGSLKLKLPCSMCRKYSSLRETLAVKVYTKFLCRKDVLTFLFCCDLTAKLIDMLLHCYTLCFRGALTLLTTENCFCSCAMSMF